MIEVKEELTKYCQQLLDERITTVRSDLKKVQDSANNETKSSMGDKYETGRAMAQNEKQKLQLSLSNLIQQKKVLNQIPSSKNTSITFGSVVKTTTQNLFLSIPLGQIEFNGDTYYALSPASPIGKLLNEKNTGDSITFNGQKIAIISVEN